LTDHRVRVLAIYTHKILLGRI